MTKETEDLHNRLQAAGVETHNLFKMFPSELLLEALASQYLDVHSIGGWERKVEYGPNGISIYTIELSVGWEHVVIKDSTLLKCLVEACERFR